MQSSAAPRRHEPCPHGIDHQVAGQPRTGSAPWKARRDWRPPCDATLPATAVLPLCCVGGGRPAKGCSGRCYPSLPWSSAWEGRGRERPEEYGQTCMRPGRPVPASLTNSGMDPTTEAHLITGAPAANRTGGPTKDPSTQESTGARHALHLSARPVSLPVVACLLLCPLGTQGLAVLASLVSPSRSRDGST